MLKQITAKSECDDLFDYFNKKDCPSNEIKTQANILIEYLNSRNTCGLSLR